jgi:hypothetical protein
MSRCKMQLLKTAHAYDLNFFFQDSVHLARGNATAVFCFANMCRRQMPNSALSPLQQEHVARQQTCVKSRRKLIPSQVSGGVRFRLVLIYPAELHRGQRRPQGGNQRQRPNTGRKSNQNRQSSTLRWMSLKLKLQHLDVRRRTWQKDAERNVKFQSRLLIYDVFGCRRGWWLHLNEPLLSVSPNNATFASSIS